MPADPAHDRVEFCEIPRVRPAGVSEQVKPVAGDIEDAKATVPVKPFAGATVMVEVLATPALAVRFVGVAAIVKS